MPITAPPTIPLITDPSTFAQRAQDWTVWQAEELYPELINQSSLLGLSLSATSITSNTIGTGSKTFTVETGKGFVEGVSLSIADANTPTNRMFAVVASYNSGTGELIVTSQAFEGSGTFTDWQIAPAFNGQINLTQIPDDLITNAKLNTDAKFGRLLNIQIFTASGTYTPTSGTKSIVVEQCGGGGGGGGADGGGAGTTSNPRSAGGGAYALKRITNMNQTFTVTIGAGGIGGAAGNNVGTDGGTTTFSQSVDGDIVTTGGGGGGANASTSGNQVGGITLGGTATGGDINLNGGDSTSRSVLSGLPATFSTSGASPRFGGGKTAQSAAINGTNATNYGEGGSSACSYNTTANYAGGDGFQGVVIVWEYA